MNPAGFWRRLGAMFYDAVLLIALWFFTALVITAINYSFTQKFLASWQNQWILFPALLLMSFIFFSWCWRRSGQTLGMQTWKIQLVSAHNNTITWKQCLMRFIGAMISWSCFGLGYVWILFNKEKLAWHDQWSNTRIILIR